ncbi:TPA: tRNA (guanosine(37)-N1)-methyltransferase TrmD [Candidatus Poribacteria bacterium]|nr:tRNA (guanosine(37)-N1)-methyltransferase TrmD [Candidatus Poribacteria bacterium]
MKIDIITVFPDMVEAALKVGVLRRAQESGLLLARVHNLRDFAEDKHRTVDDYPYGGGSGMVLKPAPIFNAVRFIMKNDSEQQYVKANRKTPPRVIYLTPQGQTFTQRLAEQLSLESHLILICGRYKGVDERVRQKLVTDEISIGDYVLSGGELPALVLIDAVVRLIPGAIGDYESAQEDSFSGDLLDCPNYTRPAEYDGMKAPEVLLSGHHEKVRKWRRQQSLKRTFERRPELLDTAYLSDEDLSFIESLKSCND